MWEKRDDSERKNVETENDPEASFMNVVAKQDKIPELEMIIKFQQCFLAPVLSMPVMIPDMELAHLTP